MTQTFTITVGHGFDPVKDFFAEMKARYGAEEALRMLENALDEEKEQLEDGETIQIKP